MQKQERYSQAKKVTLTGALVNAFLGLIKIIGGIAYHSHALFADGIHSFSDLFTDIMVVFASKYGSQEADSSHPYGHQRIETAATFLLALLLVLAGAGIAWDALDEIIKQNHDMPGVLTLPITLLSIAANEILFHYTHHIGKRIHSDLIIANAWHHRSDAASSIVVLIGLLGSMAGYLYLDAAAAIIVGLMIVKMGLSYGWNSIKELVDTAIDPVQLAEIEHVIRQVDGVWKIHQLRSRSMGRDVYVDVHILVAPHISVSEGHFIAQHVHHALLKQMPQVKDVTVHVDPEDDETVCPSMHLPNRGTLEQEFLLPLQAQFPCIDSWVLHYLDGKLIIDLFCHDHVNVKQILQDCSQARTAKQYPISDIRLFTTTGKC
ncbi:cation diffusion facilitator family transporter [Legionella septentrionalis]|uniref:Cation transporter n=1 Tax=Legionella septentrionalis TaxID=2498109 RepID=A0A433JGX5_9GAMM|nr:cation diffusion facilitator family transporter [Legionella septentrionalis]RUQ81565.1 cation transporter [Legionella septentrionalis]RUR09315.1 cation transporter [Legionella septentrionalis]RUR17116.1 cation transporter [Legionella septentrionalis]